MWTSYLWDHQHPLWLPLRLARPHHESRWGRSGTWPTWPPRHLSRPGWKLKHNRWLDKRRRDVTGRSDAGGVVKNILVPTVGCLPIIGSLSSVDGRISLSIRSKTKMDRSMVTLNPSFSPLASPMKNEAKSSTSRNSSGTIRLITYKKGFLWRVTCSPEQNATNNWTLHTFDTEPSARTFSYPVHKFASDWNVFSRSKLEDVHPFEPPFSLTRDLVGQLSANEVTVGWLQFDVFLCADNGNTPCERWINSNLLWYIYRGLHECLRCGAYTSSLIVFWKRLGKQVQLFCGFYLNEARSKLYIQAHIYLHPLLVRYPLASCAAQFLYPSTSLYSLLADIWLHYLAELVEFI